MKKFYIDIQYVTSVTIRTEHKIKQRTNETSEDFLVRKLRSDNVPVICISSEDHPEFAKLREQLGAAGYIRIQRNSCNGDHTLNPFMLNGVEFELGSTFYCAAAMKWTLQNGKKKF